MRILYLDDAGKVHANHQSKVAALGGFSIDEGEWSRVCRRITGAKGRIIPNRGHPNDWEIKSTDFVNLNNWHRAKKRKLCFAVADILARSDCRVYSITMEKVKATDALDETKFVPLMLQRILATFFEELKREGTTGSVVLDWSTYQLDHHLTRCVTSMTVAKGMELIRGGVTYGSSFALPTLQAADLIASTMRREQEGEAHVTDLAVEFRKLRYRVLVETDVLGYPIDSIKKLF